jgi:hypothetical protein
MLCGLLSVGVLYIWARWACFRLVFAWRKFGELQGRFQQETAEVLPLQSRY